MSPMLSSSPSIFDLLLHRLPFWYVLNVSVRVRLADPILRSVPLNLLPK